METPFSPTPSPKKKASSQTGSRKYLFSFATMLLLTLISFTLVGMELISAALLIPFILLLAMVQVALQLFSFMHLNQKGSAYPILFMGLGCVIALTAIVAMTFLL